MALNDWQKITRVLPGQPFGTGADGDFSSATAPTLINLSCSGTATSTTLSVSSTTLSNGDLILIHQTTGTGAGQWEINLVASGGGSTSLTLQEALNYTYTDSGGSQAQVIKIPQYANVTIQSGTWTPSTWNNNVGSILVFAASGTVTPTGTLNANYIGFSGGAGTNGDNVTAYQGYGYASLSNSQSRAANANGGGGGQKAGGDNSPGAGGGGGNGSAGAAGGQDENGAGGGTTGDANLANAEFGGGGGGGGGFSGSGGTGGRGAGMIVFYASEVSTITSITAKGANGGSAGSGEVAGGGGGAGGSVLICAGTVDIGTDKIDTRGGSGGTGTSGGTGGVGGKGRIAVYYGTSLTGSVSSTYYGTLTSEEDTSLKIGGGGGAFLYNFI